MSAQLISGARPAWTKLSTRAWAIVLASSVLPVVAVAAYIGAPVVDGLDVMIFGWTAEAALVLVSVIEIIVGLVARNRLLCLDGGLRALLVLALASPLGLLMPAFEPIAWSVVQSFNPAYACSAAPCEDAIVDTITTTGGAMLMPQCYIELVRLSDPHGGQAAALRVLRRSWPSFGPADDTAYAAEAGLMSLGRGFYRAERCEDWREPCSMREQRSHGLA